MLFAFVAGAGTALSPCVLPVLPAALAAGATGPGVHLLTLSVPRGVEGYAFTFG